MLQFYKFSLSGLVLSALLLSISYSQSITYLSPNSGQEGMNDLQVYLYANGVNFYDPYSIGIGFPESVSARALIILLPMVGSFAQDGINPH